MNGSLKRHLERMLDIYTKEEYYETLLSAKTTYFASTGQANEDDDDYESRMSAFNDWYLLQFKSGALNNTTPLEDYLSKNALPEDVTTALSEFNHGLFEYQGKGIMGGHVLKDLLHNEKIVLSKDHPSLSMVKGEFFIGRTLNYNHEAYLMNGLCILPQESKSICKKEAKKVKKLKDSKEDENFLLFTESLKTKWQRYGHVDVERIFIFPKDRTVSL
jgi:hypothetical protein